MGERSNCLSYWFPIIRGAGLPVPRTEIVRTDVELIRFFDGETPPGFSAFYDELTAAAERIGYPVFLRTGQTSGKHEWSRTCYVESGLELQSHVIAIVEYGEMADFVGLPYNVWAVREFIPLHHTFVAFEAMPVSREWRFFAEGGKVLCRHPYWPEHSIRNPSVPDWRERLRKLNTTSDDELAALDVIAGKASSLLDGPWSVDLAQKADGGWLLTDMALAESSFHWTPCPVALERWPGTQHETQEPEEYDSSSLLVPRQAGLTDDDLRQEPAGA